MLFDAIPPFADKHAEGFSFWVKVTPKAAKNRIGQLVEGAFAKKLLKIYVTAPPVDNLANKAVIELLAEYLKRPKTSIAIAAGTTTKEKKIVVKN